MYIYIYMYVCVCLCIYIYIFPLHRSSIYNRNFQFTQLQPAMTGSSG